eukprot:CAMPEP_0119466112 /NCGR_PEP_ID=MMETSP1344-20130328/921_1 /TAXON_ID=236787 /ORGANISM="Florenciella parvula, Strain CCMP2471" /LENGTH=725 /DNA_ID=CAMNT_0007498409 /DNA_START=17 /DNA_END=2194 /DNA_ORIENTATION=-
MAATPPPHAHQYGAVAEDSTPGMAKEGKRARFARLFANDIRSGAKLGVPLAAAGLVALALTSPGGGASSRFPSSGLSAVEFEAAGQLSSMDANSVALRMSNEYASSDTSHTSHQYPWKGGVVEPWRVTTLSLVNMTDGTAVAMAHMPSDVSEVELELHWKVYEEAYSSLNSTDEGGEPRRQPMASGVTGVAGQFEVTFRRAGLFHTVDAHLHGPGVGGSGVVASFSHTIMCKYVRRELRALNDDDKERYLSALEVVHRTSMKDGVELYGSSFRNFEHFTTKHLWKMTLEKCTPWHGGDVFLTSHAAFTLEFEQSLQAIDPVVSSAYWDYTLDDHYYHNEWKSRSPMLSAEWFGAYSNGTDRTTSHAIDSGRFAYIPVGTTASPGASPERNSYGILTDVMNNNPSKFVTRVDSICGLKTQAKLPGCKELKGAVAMHNLAGFRAQIEYVFHGILHMQIGGVDSCAVSFADKLAEDAKWAPYLEGIGLTLNTMWRSMVNLDMLVCPSECSADTPFSECSCSCPAYDGTISNMTFFDVYSILSSYGGSALQMLKNGVVSNTFMTQDDDRGPETIHFANLTDTEDTEMMQFLLEVLCHPGKMSQFATPLAAPNDPTFWSLHTTFDRLWAFMRSGTGPTEDWEQDWTDDDSCSMHNWLDLLPFHDFQLEASSKGIGELYTNQELYQLFDPKSPSLPYVYDNFEWEHCASGTVSSHSESPKEPDSSQSIKSN